MSRFEEGFTCTDCGHEGECDSLNYGSLSPCDDMDAFCPACESDSLKFHRPKEDR